MAAFLMKTAGNSVYKCYMILLQHQAMPAGFVSDIVIFVLKRDIKLQPTPCLQELDVVVHLLFISLITHAFPTWGGFLSAEIISMINSLFLSSSEMDYVYGNFELSFITDGCRRSV